MKYLKIFENFINENSSDYQSVGIVFIHNNKILLVHSADFSENVWSYPKGHVEKGEDPRATAIREVNEELSISLPSHFLDEMNVLDAGIVEKPKGTKYYKYFRYYLNDDEFEKYFNSEYEIDKSKLQLEEVDAAKFFDKSKAEKLIDVNLKKILDY